MYSRNIIVKQCTEYLDYIRALRYQTAKENSKQFVIKVERQVFGRMKMFQGLSKHKTNNQKRPAMIRV